MEFFSKTNAVKLRSHLDKYLVADEEDPETVRQSRRSAGSNNARWGVEPGRSGQTIRLKSCHGFYLTASDAPFLLGMTGKKVALTRPGFPNSDSDPTIEWEPIRDGFQVRLMTWCGKYLRANGGTPPWRNSITHDGPYSGATQNWVLWDVEAVEPAGDAGRVGSGSIRQYLSLMSSFSSVPEDILSAFGSEDSPKEIISRDSSSSSSSEQLSVSSAMEVFRNAKVVRLRSRHGKYLVAEDDKETVGQVHGGTSGKARWTVEFVLNSESVIRLRSCHGRYLTASSSPFRLGIAGCKVLQTLPKRLDSSLEWEPIKEGTQVKLKTRYGKFLRANSSSPPWSGSVTHDIPHRVSTQDWVLWGVEVLELRDQSAEDGTLVPVSPSARLDSTASSESDVNSLKPRKSPSSYREETEGRLVHYHIADERGEIMEEDMQGYTLYFNGKCVEELARRLEEETGIESPVVCFRSPLNGELCPLRLQLPPSIVMRVVVAPSSSLPCQISSTVADSYHPQTPIFQELSP